MKNVTLSLLFACSLLACSKSENSKSGANKTSLTNSKLVGNWAARGTINEQESLFNNKTVLLVFQINSDASFVVFKKLGAEKLKHAIVGSFESLSETEGKIHVDQNGIAALKDMNMHVSGEDVTSIVEPLKVLSDIILQMGDDSSSPTYVRMSDEELNKVLEEIRTEEEK